MNRMRLDISILFQGETEDEVRRFTDAVSDKLTIQCNEEKWPGFMELSMTWRKEPTDERLD